MRPIGILGGTFDPIHHGHLRLALEACEQLDLAQVRLIPLNIPPHRSKPVASAKDRRIMIELAISDTPELAIDLRELKTNDVSYSINTVKSLRNEFEQTPLCLILGRDAFNQIDSWYEWQELLNYVHIIVANRPGESVKEASLTVENWTKKHKTEDLSQLSNKLFGYIYFIDIPMLDISSSLIRQDWTQHKAIDDLLPAATLGYIKNKHLYQDTA